MKNLTTLLIVGDTASVRTDLRTLIELTSKVKAVGEANDFEEAVRKSQELRPDIILLDLQMFGKAAGEKTNSDFKKNTFRVITVLKNNHPKTKLLILSADDSREMEIFAIKSGADGFFVKGRDTEKLLRLMRAYEAVQERK